MIRATAGLLALAALASPGIAFAQVASPRLTVRTIEQLPRPLAAPYDSEADAGADIAAAAARARKSGKRLMVDFGANWCIDCRVFASVVELPEMRPWMAKHFEWVAVDVGRFNRNMDLAERYGIALEAVPAIFVIDPRSGKLLNRAEVQGLGEAALLTPPQMVAWLAKWAKKK
ncbi:MAG: thioredoxin family protein [Pseudomonadota bacterium]